MTAHIIDTVEVLTELVHHNVVNEGRLRDAADIADELMNKRLLNHMADKRAAIAEELQAHAATFGRVPDAEPTLVDKLGRAVTKLRGVVTSDETDTLLDKAAECESRLGNEYRDALADQRIDLEVKSVLIRQIEETADFPSMIKKIEQDECVTEASRGRGVV
ncbi:MAG: hypothetical protein ACI8P0_001027 [Planctomycetaceae bacterium]|jgi:uncharacterized protein (TIGR02284 family)